MWVGREVSIRRMQWSEEGRKAKRWRSVGIACRQYAKFGSKNEKPKAKNEVQNKRDKRAPQRTSEQRTNIRPARNTRQQHILLYPSIHEIELGRRERRAGAVDLAEGGEGVVRDGAIGFLLYVRGNVRLVRGTWFR